MITNSNLLKINPNKYVKFIRKDGYILVKNVLNKKDLANIKKCIQLNFEKYTKKKVSLKSLADEKFNLELIKLRKKNRKKFAYFFDTLQTSSALINFWTNSKILKIIEKIMKCNKAFISATDLLLRMDSPVDERNKLDWHQDSAYFKQNKYGYNGLNCWTTLTRLTYDMGPLEILEKSHKVGCLKVKKKRNNKFGSLQRKISEKITNKFILKKFEMNPGDVLFMDMDTMHRSGSNLSKIFRFSSICRYHNMSANDFNPGLNIYRYSDKKLNKEIHGF